MTQDLLTAVGARLEAQLKARETRLKTIEDAVKAKVSANPPAPFTLLSDGTKQFGYAPTAVDCAPVASDAEDFSDADVETEVLADQDASFAALVSATAQIFTDTVAAARAPVAAETPAQEEPTSASVVSAPATDVAGFGTPEAGSAAVVDAAVAVTTASAPTIATMTAAVAATPAPAATAPATAAAATPAASTTTATPTISTTDSAPTSAASAAAARSVTNTSTASVAPDYIMLSNGTKQFGYAPTGAMYTNVPRAETPPVPTDFGVGATMRRRGSTSDIPITVTRVGDGVVFANFTDSEGTREMAFYPNQMQLVTAAP